MLAVHLERVPVRPHPDRQPRADDHGGDGAVRHRDGIALEPDGGDRRHGAGAGVPDRAVRAEICDPGFAHLTATTPNTTREEHLKTRREAMQQLTKLAVATTVALWAAVG